MTIRRRLALSFLTMFVLFSLNLGVYFWSDHKRNAVMDEIREARTREILLDSLAQNLNDRQRQVALLSQDMAKAASHPVRPDEIALLKGQLADIAKDLEQIADLTAPRERARLASFTKDCEQLGASWLILYENLGVNPASANLELALRVEPLSRRVQEELPQFEAEERHRAEAARAGYYHVAALTERITILIFVLSALGSLAVVYRVSSHFTRGLSELQVGAVMIGNGILNHRIPVRHGDELGNLAKAYNEMAENLHQAQKGLTYANLEAEKRHQEVNQQKEVVESLLLNILPLQVAEELQAKGAVDPKYFEDVTILFTDFVGFTVSTEKMAAEDLARRLHEYFTTFDQIVARYYLEKLKTIGDSYMAVAGLPLGRRNRRVPSHPVDAVMAALEMVHYISERGQTESQPTWSVRVGLHTGPVIAGVVGIQKFAFDIWGDSVNFSSRMESSSAPNRVNVSDRTYWRVKDFFECEYRGKVLTKDKREVEMYFVNGILPELLDDVTQSPPPAFVRRYHVYFQKEPPAFPLYLQVLPEEQPAATAGPSSAQA